MEIIKQIDIRNDFTLLIHQTIEFVKSREGKGADALEKMNNVLELLGYLDEYQTELIGENRALKLECSQQRLKIANLKKEVTKLNKISEF